MSLGPISRVAKQFERSAPAACKTGMQIFVVAFLVACGGAAIAATASIEVGYWVVVIGIIGAVVGIAIYLKGFLSGRKPRAP